MGEKPVDDPLDWHELILKNKRPWGGFWSWRHKPFMERGATRDILEAVGLRVEELRSREEGEDPPDCEALVNGKWTGIEVTELVHRPTLERSLKAQKERAAGREPKRPEAYFNWDRDDLIAALQGLLDAKDTPGKVKGGPYDGYMLVIFTDEFFLDREIVSRFLVGATFHAAMISEAYLGLSYDPSYKAKTGGSGYPSFRLNLAPR